jgi:hypothetical protein
MQIEMRGGGLLLRPIGTQPVPLSSSSPVHVVQLRLSILFKLTGRTIFNLKHASLRYIGKKLVAVRI